jgi:predicted DNA-binding antitoxin AbrB/MazE fold protein
MGNMHKVIRAVYSGGVFKPLVKVNLREGEKVEIEIKEQKAKKITSLRGIWREVQINEEDIEKAKHIWDKGVENEVKVLEEETGA